MDQKVIQKIGKYEIVAELGQGGMGVVYKARDPFIGRLVAIKTITPDLVSEPEVLKRFYREAQAAGTLQHPNIVTIHDMGEADGCPYIVMEYVEGESLRAIINRRSDIPIAAKLRLAQQFCEGLSHAHKHGFVHRDVKPANILLTKQGIVKVVDFGIVHLSTTTLTKTGMFLGTVHYAPPEQVNDGRVDSRSDLWSVACVIYELISYKKPFDGSTMTSVIAKILTSEPEPLSACAPDSPPELDAVIAKALKKNPDDRYQSLDDMLGEILPVARRMQSNFIGNLLGEAQTLRTSGDFNGAQEKVRAALFFDHTHSDAKRLESEINSDIQRLPPEVRSKRLVTEAQQAMGRGEFAAALQAFSDAQKLHPLDKEAQALQERASREHKRASELRDALMAGQKALRLGNLEEAEKRVQHVLELDKENPAGKELQDAIRIEREARENEEDTGEIEDDEDTTAPGAAQAAPAQAAGPIETTNVLNASPLSARVTKKSKAVQPTPSSPTRTRPALAPGQKPEIRPTRVSPRVAPAPPVAVSPPAPQKSSTALVAVIILLVLVLAGGAYVFLRQKPPSGPSVEETRLEAAAQALQETGDLDAALVKWQELAARNGVLKDEANRQISLIGGKLQQEKSLYSQARAAEDQKHWDEAIGLYQKVAAMNGPLRFQAVSAISIDMQLQRGGDISKIEEQQYQQAEDAMKRNEYSVARGLYQIVVNLHVPNSTLAPKAQAAVDQINQTIKYKAEFDAADKAENSGDLQGALAQFQKIAAGSGPFKDQADARIPKLNGMINDQAAQQAFNAAIQAEKNGDMNGALAQFKAIAAKPGSFAQDAQNHVQEITDKFNFDAAVRAQNSGDLNGALAQFKVLAGKSGPLMQDAQNHVQQITDALNAQAAKQQMDAAKAQFDAADHLQSSGDLKGALAQFKTIADGSGPMKDQAQSRVAQVQALIAESNKPKPVVSSTAVSSSTSAPAASGKNPTVTVLVDPSEPWTRAVQKGMVYPNSAVDGGLKAINTSIAAIPGAAPGSIVMMTINIGEDGSVTPGPVIKDTGGLGKQVADASRSWKFNPPTVKEKSVKTSVAVRVTF